MPELRLREVRLPELRLPEMTREDIARTIEETIGDVRREVDKVELPNVDLTKVELPKVDLTKVDIPKAVATVSLIGRPARRWRLPRVPLLIGAVVAVGLVTAAVLSSPSVRPRLQELGRKAKQRMDERMAARDEAYAEAHAFDAAVAVPIQPSVYADDAPANGSPFDGSSELPEGMGDAVPAFTEDATRA